jgi:hypothetical protein
MTTVYEMPDTSAMHKSLLVALGLVLVLTACGHSSSDYGSARDLAQAIGCGDYKADGHNGVVTRNLCTYKEHPAQVFWFRNDHAAEQWRSLYLTDDTPTALFHGQWVIFCGVAADCSEFQKKVGGSLT